MRKISLGGVGQRFSIFFMVGAVVLSASSCTKKQPESAAAPSGAPAASSAGKVVNLGIWSHYLSDEKIAEFQKRTGIKVNVSLFSSNEELLAKMQAGGSTYDVVVPSDYMVFAMAKLKLLRPLDYKKLPHSKSLDPKFLKKSFDPNNEFSVPYDWGTTGIAVNRKLYPGQIKGWKDLFSKPDLAGKYSLLDDSREVIGAALKSMGYSLNSKNPDELNKAKDLLLKTRKRVKAFTSETIELMTTGELGVTHNYSTNTMVIAKGMPGSQVDYIYPEEGGTLWIDTLAVPANAPHPEEAHQLIDFLLEPATVASTVLTVFTSPANKDVLPLLPKELLSNPTVFPKEKDLAKFEMIEDLGDSLVLWDRIWTEVKASRD